MRYLQYKERRPVKGSSIQYGKRLDAPADAYYSRFSVVETEYGLVTVIEMNWATNTGKIIFTIFSTVVAGYKYEAELNDARLSERNLKWLSTHFIKTVISRLK